MENKKVTVLNNIDDLVYDLRKQTNSACVTLNLVDKNASVKSVSAAVKEKFIVNMAMSHLYHLLCNDNNRGEELGFGELENDYVQICDKTLLFKLKEKIDSILETIVTPTIYDK